MKLTDLSRFKIFDGLTAQQLSFIEPLLKPRHLRSEMLLLDKGQTDSGIYLLMKGSVKVFLPHKSRHRRNITTEPCKEVIVAICGSGETLGEIDMADEAGHTASVETLEDSTFFWMSGSDFWLCHDRMPQVGRNLSRILAGRVRWATTVQNLLTTLHVPGKVAYLLIHLAQSYGVRQADGSVLLPLTLNQSELAALVGSSREGVNRTLRKFRELGYIRTMPDKKMQIYDCQGLRDTCEGLANTSMNSI